MRRTVVVVIALFATVTRLSAASSQLSGVTAADEVRAAETAFARAFADRNQAAFFAFVLDDASFVSSLGALAGKAAVVERWSRLLGSPEAPFSWGPERAFVNAAGTIGMTAGPVFDAKGKHIGNFNSLWVKQPDGAWKILFDGPGSPAACLPKIEEGDIAAPDGATLHYYKAGDGPVTLIVPLGFILFDDFKQLGDLATVIAYDVRDRGRSSRVADATTLTIEQEVRDLESVRAHFNAERFVPVGFSYAGVVVALYAAEHPERVSRVVQLGPAPRRLGAKYPKELSNGFDDVAVPAAAVKRWRTMREEGMAAKAPREFCDAEQAVMSYVLVGEAAHAARVRSTCDLQNEWPVNLDRHYEQQLASLKKLEVDPARVHAPVLVIHGTKDRNAPYGSGREWAAALPEARLMSVPGAAHASWLDDPVTVFGSIREFLRGHWPAGAERVNR